MSDTALFALADFVWGFTRAVAAFGENVSNTELDFSFGDEIEEEE